MTALSMRVPIPLRTHRRCSGRTCRSGEAYSQTHGDCSRATAGAVQHRRSIRIEEGPPLAACNVAASADHPEPPSMRLPADAKWRADRERRRVAVCAGVRGDECEPAALPAFARALAILPFNQNESRLTR